jgi:hypothetical protein
MSGIHGVWIAVFATCAFAISRPRCKDSNPDAVYPTHIERYPIKVQKKSLDQTLGAISRQSQVECARDRDMAFPRAFCYAWETRNVGYDCKDSNPDAVYPTHIERYPIKVQKKSLDQTLGEQSNLCFTLFSF